MPHPILSRALYAAIACATLTFAACGESTAPPQPAGNAPREFSYSASAPEPGNYTYVTLEGASVVVTHRESRYGQAPRIRTVRVVPTASDWTAFWAAVDAAGVRRWTGDYLAEGYADGLGWSLRLAGNGVTIDTHGTNAYPDREGLEHHLTVTADFRTFLDALETLTGSEF